MAIIQEMQQPSPSEQIMVRESAGMDMDAVRKASVQGFRNHLLQSTRLDILPEGINPQDAVNITTQGLFVGPGIEPEIVTTNFNLTGTQIKEIQTLRGKIQQTQQELQEWASKGGARMLLWVRQAQEAKGVHQNDMNRRKLGKQPALLLRRIASWQGEIDKMLQGSISGAYINSQQAKEQEAVGNLAKIEGGEGPQHKSAAGAVVVGILGVFAIGRSPRITKAKAALFTTILTGQVLLSACTGGGTISQQSESPPGIVTTVAREGNTPPETQDPIEQEDGAKPTEPTVTIESVTVTVESSTPEPEATQAPTPTPKIETGNTINVEPGQVLPVGGTEIVYVDADQAAEELGSQFANWTIVSGPGEKTKRKIPIVTHTNEESGISAGYIAVAPKDWKWNDKSQIWEIKGKDGEKTKVVAPEVAYPGGWNEEKGQAGPITNPPKEMFVTVDPDGSVHVVLVFSPEDAKNIDPDKLVELDNGNFAYIGVPKEIELEEGETPVRDENGQLRIVRQNGSYFVVHTSWDQITNKDDILFDKTGPFGDSTTPYPPKDMTPEKANLLYTVLTDKKPENEGGKPEEQGKRVAYYVNEDGEKIITAVFTEKGWQATVPLSLESNLAVPTIQSQNPELLETSTSQFVNAMEETGIKVESQNIANNLEYSTIKDKDGNPVVVATVRIDQFPDKYKDLNGNYPLFIATQNEKGKWEWRESEIKDFEKQLLIGSTVDGSENYHNPQYNKLIKQNFSIISPAGATNPLSIEKWGGLEFSKTYFNFAHRNSLETRPGHLFYPPNSNEPPNDRLHNPSQQEVEQWMQDRANLIFDNLYPFNSVVFANEPIGVYNGNIYWVEKNNPYYHAFGKDWVTKAYVLAYDQILNKGAIPGTDTALILNLPYLTKEWGYKPGFTIQFMSQTKKKIDNHFGEDVPMDVGIQFHLRDVPQTQADWGGPHINEINIPDLVKFFRSLNQIGNVHITELSFKNIKNPKNKLEGVRIILEAAIKSGSVKDVLLWEAFKDKNGVFENFQRGPTYYEITRVLFENIEK